MAYGRRRGDRGQPPVHRRRARPVSAALVHQVAWALYGPSNRAAIIDDWSVQRPAQDCRRPKGERGVRSALNVINRIGHAVKDRPSRRLAWVWKLNVGGLDWPMVCNRAAALHKPSPVTMTGLSPVMVTGLKGYVQGQVDLVAADHVAGSTTSAAAPTEDQQQQRRDESRLDGLIGHLAVTSGALDHPFNEDRVREDLAAGRTTVGNLQRQADELAPRLGRRGETRSSRRPNQEDAEVIRMSQWAEVRHLHVVEDVPKKEIARRLKLDVKTVRRAIGRPTPPVHVSPPRPGTPARSPRSLDQPPPPAIDVDGRGERLAHDRRRDPHRGGDVAGDRAPPRRPPLRGPGRRADRARQDQAIRLVRSVSSRPVVSRSSAGEDPSRHREHPSGTEPCVVVHDLDIGRT